jgi:hypothetical protein
MLKTMVPSELQNFFWFLRYLITINQSFLGEHRTIITWPPVAYAVFSHNHLEKTTAKSQ